MTKREKTEQAVEELEGKWQDKDDYFVGLVTDCLHQRHTNYWSEDNPICTRTEFEKVAKKLGWCNGFKYGVEYQIKECKPDLPNGLNVEVYCADDDKWFAIQVRNTTLWVSWDKLRICDERYKPKEESVSDSTWYERGELPPEGEVVEVQELGSNSWQEIEITAVTDCFVIGYIRGDRESALDMYHKSWNYKFRPLLTERDKAVENASVLIHKWQIENNHSAIDLANQLANAGMLRMTEE